MTDPDCQTCGGRGHLGMQLNNRQSNKCPDCTRTCVHGKLDRVPCFECDAYFDELEAKEQPQ